MVHAVEGGVTSENATAADERARIVEWLLENAKWAREKGYPGQAEVYELSAQQLRELSHWHRPARGE